MQRYRCSYFSLSIGHAGKISSRCIYMGIRRQLLMLIGIAEVHASLCFVLPPLPAAYCPVGCIRQTYSMRACLAIACHCIGM